jgi:hypothetical protein
MAFFWGGKIVSLGNQNTTRGVSHYGLAICITKYLKEKEKKMKTSNISPCKNISSKNSLKEPKYFRMGQSMVGVPKRIVSFYIY